jgi:quinol monooxygenase YgiN
MVRRALLAALVAVCLVVPMAAQAQGDYLDVYIVNVKPEKAADFDALARKMAEANRKYNGDHWLAMDTMYGKANTTVFVSTRQSYADIDKANDAFMAALNKAYGKEAAQKMLNDWNNCIAGARTEFRRRRWDLSRKTPTDAAAYAKFIGESRVLRTTAVHVRPGRIADFENLLKEIKAASEKMENTQPLLISQVIEGGKGTTFYVSGLRTGLAGFDKNPTMREILGEEGYKKFLQQSAELIEESESSVFRFSPELSNPPEEVMAAAPDYWHPKVAMAEKTAKPKTTGVEPAAQKQKQ